MERSARTGVVDVNPAVSTNVVTNALTVVPVAVVPVATVAPGHVVVL